MGEREAAIGGNVCWDRRLSLKVIIGTAYGPTNVDTTGVNGTTWCFAD